MNQLLKELKLENKYLENKIKQLGDELNEKCKRHILEIEKTRDLYQEQIVDLIDERDELEKEVHTLKDKLQNFETKHEVPVPDQTLLITTLKEEIEKRDKVILMLEQNLKQLGEESVNMINFIEQKYIAELEKMKK
jgi:chromosome segregation ATPase